MGDPAGVGPEIILKAAACQTGRTGGPPLLVVGDLGAMRLAADLLGRGFPRPVPWNRDQAIETGGDALAVLEVSHLKRAALKPGRPGVEGGDAAYRYIETAARMAMAGEAAAMVTAPISKQWLNRAGHNFPGHSELLAEIAGVRRWRMMFAGRKLRLALVTVHMGLSLVPRALTVTRVLETIQILDQHLRTYSGLARPHVAVLGLNPHAGESGLFGREEIEIIAPAIGTARKAGIDAFGPVPPDTAFVRRAGRFAFDGAVAMYHDQGLIPVKTLDFDYAVNVTLGLPFIRTSPDHGTAYDIAGQGKAREQSLRAAISFAAVAARRAVK